VLSNLATNGRGATVECGVGDGMRTNRELNGRIASSLHSPPPNMGGWLAGSFSRQGVSGRQIKLRLASGRLRAIHRGVYLVGAVAPQWAKEQATLGSREEP
jgi:hypothetical protein